MATAPRKHGVRPSSDRIAPHFCITCRKLIHWALARCVDCGQERGNMSTTDHAFRKHYTAGPR